MSALCLSANTVWRAILTQHSKSQLRPQRTYFWNQREGSWDRSKTFWRSSRLERAVTFFKRLRRGNTLGRYKLSSGHRMYGLLGCKPRYLASRAPLQGNICQQFLHCLKPSLCFAPDRTTLKLSLSSCWCLETRWSATRVDENIAI